MLVKVKQTMAGPGGVILAGQVGEVSEVLGEALIKAKQADRVSEPEKKPEPVIETATAEPVEKAMKPPARRRKAK